MKSALSSFIKSDFAKSKKFLFLIPVPFLVIAPCLGLVNLRTFNFWAVALIIESVVAFFQFGLFKLLDKIPREVSPRFFILSVAIAVFATQISFALTYWLTRTNSSYLCVAGSKTVVENFKDALYFSVITFFTVGYGDIVPVGDFQFTAMVEVNLGVLLILAFFSWGLNIWERK